MNKKQIDERGGWTSASNAAADLRCQGRHQAQKGAPPVVDVSYDAKFGTQIHDALQKQDPTGLSNEQLSIYESCNEITLALIDKVFGPDAPNVKVIREQRMWAQVLAQPGDRAKEPKRYQHSGKLDVIVRHASKGLIIEYKTLPGDLDGSETNDQLRDQAVLAARNMVIKDIYAAICQPLVTHDPVITHYDPEAITQAEKEMFQRVRNSNSVDSKRTPNPVSCKYCTAASVCLEYQSWASRQVVEMQPVTGIPVKQWTPQQRAHFMNMRPVAQKWLDDCYQELKAVAKLGPDEVPGYALKPGAMLRPINNAQELFERFHNTGMEFAMKECGGDAVKAVTLLTELFMSCVDVSKSSLEAVVRKVTGLKGKGLAAKMDDLIAGITDDKQNEASLSKVRG